MAGLIFSSAYEGKFSALINNDLIKNMLKGLDKNNFFLIILQAVL
jgi:hypothetical protein